MTNTTVVFHTVSLVAPMTIPQSTWLARCVRGGLGPERGKDASARMDPIRLHRGINDQPTT
ncbi:hypothetical protein HPB50_006654 [Hyalomma asiaticum]|uniref:Uncharacterized protein n=1 Tax=Hyalomma asiaticum TaxID=266040 RepID=A0ACB7SVV3_HYAAI|nr:hypothetical protein HPB50_006654 [Hyalomma asiaticum]